MRAFASEKADSSWASGLLQVSALATIPEIWDKTRWNGRWKWNFVDKAVGPFPGQIGFCGMDVGTMERNRTIASAHLPILFLLAAVYVTGCGFGGLFQTPVGPAGNPYSANNVVRPVGNPIQVAVADTEFLWNQIVDTVDDYFVIESETRVIKTGDQWAEGRIKTYPEIGATYFEPWRRDALFGFQRLQSSLQTMRRTADIRVVPNGAGFQISVAVLKDLEDVDRSLNAADGSAAVRHDGSVVRTDPTLLGQPITLDWIEQERDTELEQKILREILGRVTNVAPPRRRLLHD